MTESAPDMDKIVDAFAAYVDAATYLDAIWRHVTRAYGARSPETAYRATRDLRLAAVRAEHQARVALYALLPYEAAMRLIPALDEARWGAEQRGEVAYAEAVAETEEASRV